LELEEIEAQLRRLPSVADAAVLVVERGGHPDHLVAFLLASGDAPFPHDGLALTQEIRARLAERLPAYALPRRVQLLAAPPLTANGKLDRAALRSLLP
jgi:acyl-coenzyme A synthetase/AMP-(fatty) acid ligase